MKHRCRSAVVFSTMHCHPSKVVRRLRHIILVFIALTVLAPLANAFKVTLEWDTNDEPNIAGYKVYMGSQSRSYDATFNAGFATRQDIQPLEPGRVYYFAITAYDSNGLESAFSDELTYVVSIDGATACLVPLQMTFSGASSPIMIKFVGQSALSYFVQASIDLQSWQTIFTVTPLSNGTNEWLDVEAQNYSKRFYRVISSFP
jgi:fibronectin type 3 domain-containing protein